MQEAINRAYDANKIAPFLDTLKTKALIDALARWDGRLPATLSGLWLVPADVIGAIEGLIGGAGRTAKP